MKKLISLILCCLICGITSAQLIKQKVEKQKKQSELDWFNCSFDQDSVYGAEVNKAYDYLNANKKKAKKNSKKIGKKQLKKTKSLIKEKQ